MQDGAARVRGAPLIREAFGCEQESNNAVKVSLSTACPQLSLGAWSGHRTPLTQGLRVCVCVSADFTVAHAQYVHKVTVLHLLIKVFVDFYWSPFLLLLPLLCLSL